MNDIKNSTLGERILLGIIAGLFALVGFYIGYEHLSNGVNPIIVGSITAIIVMLGCMAAAFILEELIRKIPAAKKKNYEEVRKQPVFGNKKDSATAEEPEKKEPITEEPKAEAVAPEQKPAFAKRMTLLTPAQAVEKAQKSPEKVAPNIEKDVKNKETTVNENAVSSSEWEDEEMIVKPKPVAPVRPVSPKAPEKKVEAKPEAEKQSESLSLVEFIKAHPEFSARKMVKEYRLAGGTEPTDDILNLMN